MLEDLRHKFQSEYTTVRDVLYTEERSSNSPNQYFQSLFSLWKGSIPCKRAVNSWRDTFPWFKDPLRYSLHLTLDELSLIPEARAIRDAILMFGTPKTGDQIPHDDANIRDFDPILAPLARYRFFSSQTYVSEPEKLHYVYFGITESPIQKGDRLVFLKPVSLFPEQTENHSSIKTILLRPVDGGSFRFLGSALTLAFICGCCHVLPPPRFKFELQERQHCRFCLGAEYLWMKTTGLSKLSFWNSRCVEGFDIE